MTTSDSWTAFNLGADHRIAGQPLSTGPYAPGEEGYSYFAWGWRHADSSWGKDSRRRAVRKLPEVAK